MLRAAQSMIRDLADRTPSFQQLKELVIRRVIDPTGWAVARDASVDPADMLSTICRAVYDPRRDDAAFRRSLGGDEGQRRVDFDQLRKQYPPRREIDSLQIEISAAEPKLERIVDALGATLKR